MASAKPAIVFFAARIETARRAADAFTTAGGKIGLPWAVHAVGSDHKEAVATGDVKVMVLIDLPAPALPGSPTQYEAISSTGLDEEINKLIARLLGGNDKAVSPPSAPPAVAPPKKQHTVKVRRETSGRRGKAVTVISELPLNESQLQELATKLKSACGSGGTAKEGNIEIQGDHREKIATELEKLGYKVKRA